MATYDTYVFERPNGEIENIRVPRCIAGPLEVAQSLQHCIVLYKVPKNYFVWGEKRNGTTGRIDGAVFTLLSYRGYQWEHCETGVKVAKNLTEKKISEIWKEWHNYDH